MPVPSPNVGSSDVLASFPKQRRNLAAHGPVHILVAEDLILCLLEATFILLSIDAPRQRQALFGEKRFRDARALLSPNLVTLPAYPAVPLIEEDAALTVGVLSITRRPPETANIGRTE
jgi:hypothetical protein